MLSADLLRRLDRWIGLPLVWLLGVVTLPWRWRVRPTADQDGALLVVQLSEMGSVIIAEPALRQIAANRGAFHFLILERNADCLKLLPALATDRVFILRDSSLWLLAWDSLRFLRWCRRQRLSTVLDLELFSRFSVLLAVLSGARRRIGFCHPGEGLSQGGLLTEPVAYNPYRHMLDNYRALVEQLLGGAPDAELSAPVPLGVTPFPLDAGLQRMVERRVGGLFGRAPPMRRRVLVQVGAESVLPQRNWPRNHWISLIEGLIAQGEVEVLLCGRQQEWAEAEQIRAGVGSEYCANGCGRFDLVELPHLYRCVDLLISADSGPAHFAAVTELPVLVLFGPETPQLFRPLGRATVLYAGLGCSPCVTAANHRSTRCRDNRCMQQILPQQVMTEALRLLSCNDVVRLPLQPAVRASAAGTRRA